MLRIFVVAFLCLGMVVSETSASGVAYLDQFDDPEIINAIADVEQVQEFREKLQGLADRLLKLDQVSLAAILGKSGEKPSKTFAMPLGETRNIVLSGTRSADDRRPDEDFVRFHPVSDFAAVEFYYSRQKTAGDAPLAMRIYLKVDKTFPKLTKDNLDQRMDWDRLQLRKLVKQIAKRADELPSGASGSELKDLVNHFGAAEEADCLYTASRMPPQMQVPPAPPVLAIKALGLAEAFLAKKFPKDDTLYCQSARLTDAVLAPIGGEPHWDLVYRHAGAERRVNPKDGKEGFNDFHVYVTMDSHVSLEWPIVAE